MEPTREELLRLVSELNSETEELRRRLDESDWMGGALKQRTRVLNERIKELHCAYELVRLIRSPASLEAKIDAALALLPPAWQHAEFAGARIELDGVERRTHGFTASAWRMSEPIRSEHAVVGSVEISYSRAFPASDEGPFLKEERALLKIVAEALGAMRRC